MSVSVVACGAKASSSSKDLSSTVKQREESNGELSSVMTRDQWIDALGETSTLTFKKDGSGKFNNNTVTSNFT